MGKALVMANMDTMQHHRQHAAQKSAANHGTLSYSINTLISNMNNTVKYTNTKRKATMQMRNWAVFNVTQWRRFPWSTTLQQWFTYDLTVPYFEDNYTDGSTM